MGMNIEVDLDIEELLIMGDSDLIIRQAQGEWETRDIKLLTYMQHVEELSKQLKFVEFRYIPRFHNELSDALATLASMLPYPGNVHIDPLEIQIRERHGYYNAIEIKPYVQPWCVDTREAEKIMNKVHSGVYGPHMNGYVPAPWQFVAWGKDVIGPIELKASNGHIFILVVIDYFKKWVKAVTFKAVTKKEVVDFVHSNIICHFGIPKNYYYRQCCKSEQSLDERGIRIVEITHLNSTPYRPKANDANEAANKNIKKILRKMIQSSTKWHEKLPFALLGYRTTVRTSVGATPYLLVYETEAIIPTEV
ncbi:uncharacterized protein LOC142175369 [Nicotiana tabacum]|uniref:Uncharacterized protein LOC142175369 n=1 Tax=Nicotiana tabacum TaxID=4097 RepID=A0AC58TLE8_TOBAC